MNEAPRRYDDRLNPRYKEVQRDYSHRLFGLAIPFGIILLLAPFLIPARILDLDEVTDFIALGVIAVIAFVEAFVLILLILRKPTYYVISAQLLEYSALGGLRRKAIRLDALDSFQKVGLTEKNALILLRSESKVIHGVDADFLTDMKSFIETLRSNGVRELLPGQASEAG